MTTSKVRFNQAAFGACLAIAVLMSVLCFASKGVLADSKIYGKSLATWMEIYERWAFGQTTIPTDSNGNAVVDGVVLMPVPKAFGNGTRANVEVRMTEGQPFALPLWVLLGTSYDDGTPDDPFEPVSIFTTLDINFQVDDRTIINSSNALDYFSKFEFIPKIPVSFPPINGIIWFEGIGTVQPGFTVGKHTLKLDAKNTQPAFGTIFEYHNTWNVNVKKK